ncbi:MAG TPA: efflux transporter outer membrane subunit [Catalimonadaceae bacterium]|nr:efflux transporter outer membrane subunit [Catalimonadaceae bacterium]
MNKNLIVSGLLLLSLWGCVPKNQGPIDSFALKIPKTYGSVDSLKQPLALPSWKTFFEDSQLVALVNEVLVKNFDLNMAMQRLEMVRSEVVFTNGIRLPDLNAGIGAGVRRFGEYTMDGVGNFDTRKSPNLNDKQQLPNPIPDFTIGLSASWEIDLWGKLKSRKKAALARFLAGEQGKNLVLTALISNVAFQYYDLLNLTTELGIIEENYQLQSKAFEVVSIQKQSGMANQLGVEILQAQMLSSSARIFEIRQRLVAAESNLNLLLGRFPQSIPVRSNFLDMPLSSRFPNGIPSEILNNRPDIIQAEYELKARNADLQAARMAFYPSLNISTSIGFQAFNAALLLESPASLAYTALSGLTAPLLNRRQLKANLLMSKAEQKTAYLNYEKTVVSGFAEVYNSLNNIENTEKMFEIKSQEVAVLKQSVSTSADLFRTGRATYLEVVNAQRNSLQSQLELSELKMRQFHARIELFRALGGGWKQN